MNQAQILASVIEELTRDFPCEAVFNELELTCLKGSETPIASLPMDAGYEDERDETFYVMADVFTEESGIPERGDEWEADEDLFKVMRVEPFPNKKTPLFYKITCIKQNEDEEDE